ncbi:velvet factor-domain-containing protein [Gongronella butleri]|nr:velvet factor-domain-containing protein [Gongronella butleri]
MSWHGRERLIRFAMSHRKQAHALVIDQQPLQGQVSSHKERGRKCIDPPAVVRLVSEACQEYMSLLESPTLCMCANLVHENNDNEVYTPNHLALAGQVVSSLFKFRDQDDKVQGYFVFGDLSVKVPGTFRLRLTLLDVTSNGAQCHASIFTNAFKVYAATDFPVIPLESTPLSRCLSNQGARVRLHRPVPCIGVRKRSFMDDDAVTHDHNTSPPHTPPPLEMGLRPIEKILPFFHDEPIQLPPIKRQSITRPWYEESTSTFLRPFLLP